MGGFWGLECTKSSPEPGSSRIFRGRTHHGALVHHNAHRHNPARRAMKPESRQHRTLAPVPRKGPGASGHWSLASRAVPTGLPRPEQASQPGPAA